MILGRITAGQIETVPRPSCCSAAATSANMMSSCSRPPGLSLCAMSSRSSESWVTPRLPRWRRGVVDLYTETAAVNPGAGEGTPAGQPALIA